MRIDPPLLKDYSQKCPACGHLAVEHLILNHRLCAHRIKPLRRLIRKFIGFPKPHWACQCRYWDSNWEVVGLAIPRKS